MGQKAKNFFITAHIAWESAHKNADESGCGVTFANQDNGERYAVILDRSRILFLDADNRYSYSRLTGTTRGTGKVKFTPPAEVNITLIVTDDYAFILVDGKLVGEYTLSQSRSLNDDLGVSVLSGKNNDYGIRCTMTHIHNWLPNKYNMPDEQPLPQARVVDFKSNCLLPFPPH